MKKILLILSLLFVFSCSKDDDSSKAHITEDIVVYNNVKVIDPGSMELDMTAEQLEAGIYKFTITGESPSINIGDIIVGKEGRGFLRRVLDVSVDNGEITLLTSQASMADVFKKGSFNFSTDMNELEQGKKMSAGYSQAIGIKVLGQAQNNSTLKINEGSIDFDPNWDFDFSFDESGLKSFELSTKGSQLLLNLSLQLEASQAVSLPEQEVEILAPYSKTVYFMAGEIPVVAFIELELRAKCSFEVSDDISLKGDYTSTTNFDFGVKYENGTWNRIDDINTDSQFTLTNKNKNISIGTVITVMPRVSFKLYDVAGPYVEIGPKFNLTGHIANSNQNADFDLEAKASIRAAAGVNVSILDDHITADANVNLETDVLEIYKLPNEMIEVSGNSQFGSLGQPLPNPIKVRVIDSQDVGWSGIPVHFEVVSGGGTINNSVVLTDSNGYAQVSWTIGNTGGQVLKAFVKKGNGENIQDSPLLFTAVLANCQGSNLAVNISAVGNTAIANVTGGQPPYSYVWSNNATTQTISNLSNITYDVIVTDTLGCTVTGSITINNNSSAGTVTDYDGNSYPTVTIGEQVWMQANLNVGHYRNGDPINEVQEGWWWTSAAGAWCYYENNPANGTIYGKLYNWNAVNDPRGLAPEGWHIATYADWQILGYYLGGEAMAGGKMKSTTGWNAPNSGATNSSGFTGLPGGFRWDDESNGAFGGVGHVGYWWSSTSNGVCCGSAWYVALGYNNNGLTSSHSTSQYGYSVRCVKD